MITIKRKLLSQDRIQPSVRKNIRRWNIATYLKTEKGYFIPISKIFVYNKIGVICTLEKLLDFGIELGYKSNAEAYILDSDKTYTLLKRKKVKLDGEIFYTGSENYCFYLPIELFNIFKVSDFVETFSTYKNIKKIYELELKKYQGHKIIGEFLLEKINFSNNQNFIDDFYKTFNFRNVSNFNMTKESLFENFDEKTKKELISNIKIFLEKYNEFQLER